MADPTVASLSAALGGHLAPYPGFALPETPVTAVHVSELTDPTGYLSGGELLLTTGLSLPTSRAGCDAYVARLRQAGVSALGIGLGPVHREPPSSVVAACRRLGLPLLVVPAPTPFLTISRAYWRAVARSSERMLTNALAVQQALVDAAAATDPVVGVLRGLAGALDGWAAVLSPHGVVEEIHPRGHAADAAALQREISRLEVAGIHSAASFGSAEQYVAVFPMTVESQAVGYLAVGTTAKPDASARRTILTAAALLSLVTSYAERLRAGGRAGKEAVAALLELGHLDAARDLAEESRGAPVPMRARVLTVRSSAWAAVAASVESLQPGAYGRRADDGTCWFLLSADAVEQQVTTVLRRADADAAGVLMPASRVEETASMVGRSREALAGLAAGQWMAAGGAEVAHDGGLDRLVAAASPEVVSALAAYLRHRGHWEAAARELGVHRNTLRYRIGRAASLLGGDVDDPDVAARLWLGMRARLLA